MQRFKGLVSTMLSLVALLVGMVMPSPAAAAGESIYWGAYIEGAPANTALIDAFESRVGKKMSMEMFGRPWKMGGAYVPFPQGYLQTLRDRGKIGVVDWGSSNLGGGAYQPDFQLADIANGNHDAFLRSWAAAAKAWGHPFMLRFDAEMNGWWLPWSEQTNGNRPGDFARAWRHVHDIFSAQGATNVSWVWCPNIVGPRSTPMAGLYPGGGYVDWACLDGYNWGTSNSNTGYWSFTQVFTGSSYNGGYNSIQLLKQAAVGKPIMIGEVASAEQGGSKSAWISSLLSTELPYRFPEIKAVLWFNWNMGDWGITWPIESSWASSNAFRASIASSYYASNTFGSISTSPIPPLNSAAPAAAVAAPSVAGPAPAPAPAPASGTISLSDIADTFTDAANPNSTAGGTATTIRSDGDPRDVTFLKFDLSSLQGRTLASMKLHLHVKADASTAPQLVYLVTDTAWQEQYMSANNSVVVTNTLLGSFTPATPNAWYDVNLSLAALQPFVGRQVSLAIRDASGDGAEYDSRETGAATAPRLLVTTR